MTVESHRRHIGNDPKVYSEDAFVSWNVTHPTGDETSLIYEPGMPEYTTVELSLEGDWLVGMFTVKGLLGILKERLRQEILGWNTEHDAEEGGIYHIVPLIAQYLTKVSVATARLRSPMLPDDVSREPQRQELKERLTQLAALCVAGLEMMDNPEWT